MSKEASRAEKSGIGADIQKKMEAKYDQAVEEGTPQRVVAWINAVVGSDHAPCPGHSAEEIAAHLKSGVVLCKLMNRLVGNSSLKAKDSTQRFVCMGQIESFVKKAESFFGMKPTETFQANDLYEGIKANMINIVNCLHEVGLRANAKGIVPKYEGSGKMATENVRGFTDEEIKAKSASVLTKVGAGSTGGATQAGISFGQTRKI
ncbi:muscle-specific protein 20-like [Oscarella lobularis]|uniref:muscle-specific protein 20-like n=1 Tax=Oscarella lobularis TaxID=121494 RepID=UPI003313C143